MAESHYDIVIIGAGIAGVSAAYFLSERGAGRILVVERERQPAYHATGRSASTLVELDSNYTIQRLKLLGGNFLRNPPEGMSELPLVERRGVLLLFRSDGWRMLEQFAPAFRGDGLNLELLSATQAGQRVGVLDTTLFEGAALLPDGGYIDVHQLLSSYLRGARSRGVELWTTAEVTGIDCSSRGVWLETSRGCIRASLAVNAAGAWAGPIARMAGATAIPLEPLRRSIAVFPAPQGIDVSAWPLVWSDPHELYFRPEPNGVILFCPMDEVPLEPSDPSADDTAIAAGIERLRALAPALVPRRFVRKWAGLRTFSSDRVPVVGFDPTLEGFFWLAGQGGCGIETSPILGQIAADLICGGKSERFETSLLAPARFVPTR